MPTPLYRTLTQLRRAFWRDHPQFAAEFRAHKRQNNYRCDIRMAWCDYVESLSRNGDISGALTARATL